MDLEGIAGNIANAYSNGNGGPYHSDESNDDAASSDEDNGQLEHTEISDKEFFNEIAERVTNSLKRKFNRNSCKADKRKRARIESESCNELVQVKPPRVSSRCNMAYLHEVLKSFAQSDHKKGLVTAAGFGPILSFDGCVVPRAFAQHIADNTSVQHQEICIHEKCIKLSPLSVHDVLGIPLGHRKIVIDEEAGKMRFLALFGLTELPPIKFFGNKIMSEDLDDDQFIRCVLVVVLSTFLCPTSSTYPSTKYLSCLVNIEEIKDLQWCQLVHDWSMAFIDKYQRKRLKLYQSSSTLGGCIYHLAVRCLDHLDFGSIQLPSTLPRIFVWKGDLIKDFSKMDLEKGKYGARNVKNECDVVFTRYHIAASHVHAAADNNIRDLIDSVASDSLCSKVKDNIAACFQDYVNNEIEDCFSKTKSLVLSVIKLVLRNSHAESLR